MAKIPREPEKKKKPVQSSSEEEETSSDSEPKLTQKSSPAVPSGKSTAAVKPRQVESSSEEETSSDSEPELPQKPSAAASPRKLSARSTSPAAVKPQQKPQPSSESESESDSEEAQKVAPVPPKSALKSKSAKPSKLAADPVAPAAQKSKPSKVSKSASDPAAPKSKPAKVAKPASDPVTQATMKRPAEASDSKKKKITKKQVEPSEASGKKLDVPSASTKKQVDPSASAKKQGDPSASTKKQGDPSASTKKQAGSTRKKVADPVIPSVTPATLKRPAEEKSFDSKKSKKKAKQAEPTEASMKKLDVPESSTKKQGDPAEPTEASVKKIDLPESSTKKQDDPSSMKKQAGSTKKNVTFDESSKKDTGEQSVKKYNSFQRIWSVDDEIVLLKGWTDYHAINNADPVDLNAFLKTIIKDLDFVNVTPQQLQTKMRRIKAKFVKNFTKEMEEKLRLKPDSHELKAYEMSKVLWGDSEGKKFLEKKRVEAAKSDAAPAAGTTVGANSNSVLIRLPGKLVGGKANKRISDMGDEMFPDGTEDGEKWKRMKMKEALAYTRHLKIKTWQARFVMRKMRPAGN